MHGGLVFTLADSCFAVACNGYNQKFVSQHGEITFMAPAFEGDVLTATAEEKTRQGRNGVMTLQCVTKNKTSSHCSEAYAVPSKERILR